MNCAVVKIISSQNQKHALTISFSCAHHFTKIPKSETFHHFTKIQKPTNFEKRTTISYWGGRSLKLELSRFRSRGVDEGKRRAWGRRRLVGLVREESSWMERRGRMLRRDRGKSKGKGAAGRRREEKVREIGCCWSARRARGQRRLVARTEKRSRGRLRGRAEWGEEKGGCLDGGEKEKGKGSCSKPLLYINIIIRYNNWILDIINLWISVSHPYPYPITDIRIRRMQKNCIRICMGCRFWCVYPRISESEWHPYLLVINYRNSYLITTLIHNLITIPIV